MTYLFLVIGFLLLMHFQIKITHELLFANSIIIFVAYGLEIMAFKT